MYQNPKVNLARFKILDFFKKEMQQKHFFKFNADFFPLTSPGLFQNNAVLIWSVSLSFFLFKRQFGWLDEVPLGQFLSRCALKQSASWPETFGKLQLKDLFLFPKSSQILVNAPNLVQLMAPPSEVTAKSKYVSWCCRSFHINSYYAIKNIKCFC